MSEDIKDIKDFMNFVIDISWGWWNRKLNLFGKIILFNGVLVHFLFWVCLGLIHLIMYIVTKLIIWLFMKGDTNIQQE